MWCLGTRFIGGLGNIRLIVGLKDLRGLFQPKLFYDSIFCSCFLTISLYGKDPGIVLRESYCSEKNKLPPLY